LTQGDEMGIPWNGKRNTMKAANISEAKDTPVERNVIACRYNKPCPSFVKASLKNAFSAQGGRKWQMCCSGSTKPKHCMETYIKLV